MGRVIVIEFTSIDGIVEDPDGSQGTSFGGWAFRDGDAAVSDDKFGLGSILQSGSLLFGRRTWQLFAGRWPARTGPFADAMNAIPKLVASTTLNDVSAWNNSVLLDGDLLAEVTARRADRELVVVGSIGVTAALASADLVDEYRLLVVPEVVGHGRRLFPDGSVARRLELIDATTVGPAVLLRLGVSTARPRPSATEG